MKSWNHEHTFILKSPTVRIFGDRVHEVQPWRVEVTLKGQRGVHYLLSEVSTKYLALSWLKHETYRRGIFSTRPFVLGMPVDRSTNRCLYALTQVLCALRGVKAYDVWQEAHPTLNEFTPVDLDFIFHQADWEGFVFPKVWAPETVDQLVAGLRGCGDPKLADAVQRRFGSQR